MTPSWRLRTPFVHAAMVGFRKAIASSVFDPRNGSGERVVGWLIGRHHVLYSEGWRRLARASVGCRARMRCSDVFMSTSTRMTEASS